VTSRKRGISLAEQSTQCEESLRPLHTAQQAASRATDEQIGVIPGWNGADDTCEELTGGTPIKFF
jgi:hypothetical protein